MRAAAVTVSCIVLVAQLCAAQNVSVGLQDLVPNCRIFSQFSIGMALFAGYPSIRVTQSPLTAFFTE